MRKIEVLGICKIWTASFMLKPEGCLATTERASRALRSEEASFRFRNIFMSWQEIPLMSTMQTDLLRSIDAPIFRPYAGIIL